MRDQDYERIERYLAGELPEAERSAFEAQLRTDAALAEAFAERQRMNRYLDYRAGNGLKTSDITDLGNAFFATPPVSSTPTPPRKRWVILLIGIVIALLGGLVWWASRDAEALDFDDYYRQEIQHQPIALARDNAPFCPNLDQAVATFNAARYTDALPLLETCERQLLADPQVDLALGISYLETENFEDALRQFDALARDKLSLFSPTANWYRALTLMKMERRAEARALFQQIRDNQGDHSNAARAILQRYFEK